MAGRFESNQKHKYRTHGAVAYDIRSTAQPRQQPVVLPEERKAPPVRVKRVRARTQIAPFSVLGIAVTVFLAVLVIFGYVRLYQADTAISSLEQELAEQQALQQRLQSTYESQIDLAAVEARASALGMTKGESSRIVYVDLGGDDYAVITPVKTPNIFVTVYRAIRDSVQGFVEYLS